MGSNGRTEVVYPCGRCPACEVGAACQRGMTADRLPDPHCSWCGHHSHDGACDGCPCARQENT